MFDLFAFTEVLVQSNSRVSVPLTIHKQSNNIMEKNVQHQGLTKTGTNVGQMTCSKCTDGLLCLIHPYLIKTRSKG